MQITVFGASGNIGQRVVHQLLSRGYSVVAFVYADNPFAYHERLQIIKGDIHDAPIVTHAIQGSDVVISTLGSWHTKTQDILSAGMRRIIPAMQAQQVRRIVTLTGADAYMATDTPTVWQRMLRPVFRRIAPKILDDAEEHIRLLMASGLAWTVVRSPVMRSRGKAGRALLRDVPPRPWQTVHRDDVARAIVEVALSDEFIHRAPYVGR